MYNLWPIISWLLSCADTGVIPRNLGSKWKTGMGNQTKIKTKAWAETIAKHCGGSRFHWFSLGKLLNKQNNTNNNSQGGHQNPELLQYICKIPSFSKKLWDMQRNKVIHIRGTGRGSTRSYEWVQSLNLADRAFKAAVTWTKGNNALKIKGKYDDNDSISREAKQKEELEERTKWKSSSSKVK